MARGRPTKFKKDMIKDAELLAGIGLTEKDLATYWGVSKRTFEYWKRHNEGELLHALLKGRLSANITVTKQLYNQATQGNVTAIIFWLINRCSEYWKDRKAMINQVIGGRGDGRFRGDVDVIDKGRDRETLGIGKADPVNAGPVGIKGQGSGID